MWSGGVILFFCRLNERDGFSLVELAISISVIGLVLASVIKGQEVIENARVARTLAQVKSYQAAMLSFKDLYAGYPGDLLDAKSVLPGCSSNVDCENGNGNGKIETDSLNPDWDYSMYFGAGAAPEAYYAWKQLALAEMISDVNVNINADGGSSASLGFGQAYPKSSFDGGFSAFFDDDFRPDDFNLKRSGHFFRLFNGSFISGGNSAGHLRPLVAMAMDRKIDDGLPYSGLVLAAGGSECLDDSGNISATYNADASGDVKACMLFFKFGGRRQ